MSRFILTAVVGVGCVAPPASSTKSHTGLYAPSPDSGASPSHDSAELDSGDDSGEPPGRPEPDPANFLGAGLVALPGPCGDRVPGVTAASVSWELTETGGGTDAHGMPQVVVRLLRLQVELDAVDEDGALHDGAVRIRAEPGSDGVVTSPWFVLEEPIGRAADRCGVPLRTVEVSRLGIEGTSTLLFGFGEPWDLELVMVDADGYHSAPVTVSTETPR